MIEVYLDGSAEVIAHIGSLDEKMTLALRKAIGNLTTRLQDHVKNDKLSGQVLGVRTGRGKRSIHQKVTIDGSRVIGEVTTNVGYMIGWETGWQGAAERSLKSAKKKFSLSASGDTFKNGSPKKRAFLVPSLKEMVSSGEIAQGIDAAVAGAVQ